MNWFNHQVQGEPTHTSYDKRFSIQWAGRRYPPVASYRLYDSKTRREYYGLINEAHGESLATNIAAGQIVKIGLVACCGEKRKHADCACLLYQSQLFKAAYDYCEQNYDLVYILSAKYGFLKPTQIIEPYDHKLTAAEGDDWGRKVVERIENYRSLPDRTERVFYAHAGKLYTDPLVHRLPMELPMRGMGIGQQLAFYKKHHVS